MKDHVYLFIALATILSMVMVGCATAATEVAPGEPAAEDSGETQSAAAEVDQEKETSAPEAQEYHVYEPEGVIIVTPPEYSVEPTSLDDIQDAERPPDAEYLRPVFGFNLYRDGEKVTDGPVPSIEIWVRWTPEDAKPPGEGTTPPRLVLLWKKDEGWQYADTVYPVVYCPPDFPALGGVARLTITEWQPGDDPRIGWAD